MEGLVPLVPSALADLRVTQVLLVLPDLRAMLVNADLPDQKALEVFRVLLDPLVAELEEPLFLAPKVLGVQPDLRAPQDLRVTMVFQVLLAPPGQMVNPDPKARMDLLVPLDRLDRLDPKVLPDLQESVVPPVRTQSPLSSTGISPRTRRLRPTARRLTSKTRSDRPTRSRTVLGTTLR